MSADTRPSWAPPPPPRRRPGTGWPAWGLFLLPDTRAFQIRTGRCRRRTNESAHILSLNARYRGYEDRRDRDADADAVAFFDRLALTRTFESLYE